MNPYVISYHTCHHDILNLLIFIAMEYKCCDVVRRSMILIIRRVRVDCIEYNIEYRVDAK